MSRPLAAAFCLALAGAITAAGSPGRDGCGDRYTVVRGDTLTRIARRCGSSVSLIAAASRIANPNRIEVGQRLIIPGGRSQAAAAPAEPGKVEQAPAASASGLTYRIAPTDTLYSLARWSRVSLDALIRANPGMDPRAIELGDTVRLPAGAVAPDAARRREGRPGYARAAPPPPSRASAPEPRRDDDEIKPEDEDEREPMGM
jgi:LysM repeat protein